MKNNIKNTLLRAAQAAVIAAVALTLFSWVLANTENPAKMNIAPDMIWVLQGVIIVALCTAIYYIVRSNKRFGLDWYHELWESVVAVVLALAYCIASKYIPVEADNLLILSGPVTTLIVAIFWPESGRSIIAGTLWLSTLCIFELTESYGGLYGLISWFYPGMPIMVGVVVAGRSLRWLFTQKIEDPKQA